MNTVSECSEWFLYSNCRTYSVGLWLDNISTMLNFTNYFLSWDISKKSVLSGEWQASRPPAFFHFANFLGNKLPISMRYIAFRTFVWKFSGIPFNLRYICDMNYEWCDQLSTIFRGKSVKFTRNCRYYLKRLRCNSFLFNSHKEINNAVNYVVKKLLLN